MKSLKEFHEAIKRLSKHNEGLPKELLKTQLRKSAKKDLHGFDHNRFKLFFELLLDEDFIKNLYCNTNKTSSNFDPEIQIL